MKTKEFIIIISFSLTLIAASPQSFLNILPQIRDQFQMDLFVTVATQNSPMSNQLLQELHQTLSVPTIHYSNVWHAPEQVDECVHTKIVLENFSRNFLLIAIIDGVAARDDLLEQIFALRYRNPMAKVIFFLAENTTMTMTALQGLIRNCSHSYVVDVVFFQNQDPPQMFTYHPFNDLQIIKLRKVSDFFANRLMNFNRYPLKVYKYHSPPRIIESQDGEQVLGYAGHLVSSYLKKRNATVVVIPRVEKTTVFKEIMDLLASHQLDVSWGVYPVHLIELGAKSYPVVFEKFCIMVPAPKVIPVYRNFLKPFEQNVWIAVICGTFYMTTVTYVVNAVVNGTRDISAALTTSLCFIIARGEIGIFSNLNRRLFIIYLLLFFLGFILSNMYCALVTTFLTTPSYEHEIKTLDDIAVAGLKILAELSEVYHLRAHNIYEKYQPFLVPLTSEEMMEVRSTMNNTNPTSISTDSFAFLNDIQKYQNDIKFKITNLCPLEVHFAIALKDDTFLVEDVSSHVLLAQQSGLLNYWKTNAFFEALRSGYLHLKRGNKEFGPIQLTLTHLQIAFYILIFGLAISISAFIAEHLYHNLLKCRKH